MASHHSWPALTRYGASGDVRGELNCYCPDDGAF
jgi:hypothetical protein